MQGRMGVRRRAAVVGLTALALVGVGGIPVRAEEVPPDPPPDTSTMTESMLGIETGVATAATSELFGWTLSALGINASGSGDLEIEDELSEIYGQLVDIDQELDDIDAELELETCELEASETTFDATTQIAYWNSQLEEMQDVGVTEEQLTDFVTGVLDSDTSSIPYALIAIDQALMDSGSIPGVISSCLDVLDTPADGTGGDSDYYDEVADLTTYFYGYQVEGLNLVVEAFHLLATEAYYEGDAPAEITADTLNTICTLAVPETSIYTYCNDAVYWVSLVYQNLQDQFSFAGAAYSVDGDSLTVNGSDYVFVQSLEAFTEAQSSACSSPLDSSDPCGPLAGTNATTSVAPPSAFAWRTDWEVASPEAWQGILDWWTDDDDSLGTYLDGLGFLNTTNSTKIILTDTTYTATPEEIIDGSEQALFSSPAVCFLDTAIERKDAHQPWCYNGSNDGVDYGESEDLVDDLSGNDCSHWTAPSEYTADDTNGFFDGTWAVGNTCDETGWIDDIVPGWILDDSGVSATQYLWPMFDMSTASCNTNLSGLVRSTTNPQGVYTMCGDDFDLWFATIVPTPTVTDVAPSASASSTTSGGDITVTTGAWDTDASITVTANSEPLLLDDTRTDWAGRLEKTYRLPADFPPGEHTITLVGVRKGARYTLVVPFTVAPAPSFTG